MEKVEVVDLSERSGVLHTGVRALLLKVTVGLDGIQRGTQVGIDGVSATCGGWVF